MPPTPFGTTVIRTYIMGMSPIDLRSPSRSLSGGVVPPYTLPNPSATTVYNKSISS